MARTPSATIDLWRGFAFDNPAQIDFLKSPAKYRLLSSGRGGGKLLALDTPIFTPEGWRTMGELCVGDRVYDEQGQPCNVTAIFDEWPERAYRMRFNDSSEIVCGGEHQWVTWDGNARKAFNRSEKVGKSALPADWPTWRSGSRRNCHGPEVRTSDEIAGSLNIAQGHNHSIPVCSPIELPDADLPIDPYVFGIWLGDGNATTANITTADAEVLDEVEAAGYAVKRVPSTPYGYRIGGTGHTRDAATGQMTANSSLESELKRLGVMGDKHCPDLYLYSSAAQRLAVLQGLMDSDGCASGEGKGTVEFCNTNPELAGAVMWLARSLGQKARLGVGRATLYGKDCGPKYRVTWRPTIPVFRLRRKLDRIPLDSAQFTRSLHRFIVAMDQVPVQPMRCITVDSTHHLYLAGSALIPTHNSVVGCRESIRCALVFPGSRNMVARLKSTELEASTHVTFRREMRAIGLVKDRDYKFNSNKNTYYWTNGSETVFSHLEDEEKFGSVELSTIFVDEGSQVPDSVYQMIFPANLRWEVGPHRAWFCTNPGASGWLKDIVDGVSKGTNHEDFHERAGGGIERVVDEYAWFPVKPGWNKHNPGGQRYFDDLAKQGERYGPHWVARYLDGSWDSFEGARFPMFDRNRHILATPWRPTGRHEIVIGVDFGHRETFVTWLAWDPRSNEPVVVFHELQYQEVLEPKDVASEVLRTNKEYGIERCISLGDPAGISASTFSSVSPIAAYAALGWMIAPCREGKDPRGRADLIAALLTEERRQPDGSYWPGLVFGPNCPALIKSITSYRWDTSKNGSVEKFVKEDDHGVDSLGYGLLGVPPPDMSQHEITPGPGVNISARDMLARLSG